MVNSGDLGSSSSTRDHQGTCFIISCFMRLPQYIPYPLPLKEISSVGIFSSIILLFLGDNHKLFSQPLCHLHRYLCVHCCTSLGTVLRWVPLCLYNARLSKRNSQLQLSQCLSGLPFISGWCHLCPISRRPPIQRSFLILQSVDFLFTLVLSLHAYKF